MVGSHRSRIVKGVQRRAKREPPIKACCTASREEGGGGVAGKGNGIKEERFINFTRRRKGRTLRRGKSKRRRNRSG